ncbi:MAG: hypothetical protein H0V30_14485 [Chitinophagaceae bacterium]|jgi:uncharacterized protein YcfL|nr:hypothetical protein [Chitinophagaceae bacterium]
MKNIIFIAVITIICFSCTSPIVNSIVETDSVVIEFAIPEPGAVSKTVATTNSAAIHRLIGFVDSKEVQAMPCVYKGKVFFFQQGNKLLEAQFADAEDCRYFSFTLDGVLHHTRMNHEAVDFFKSLEEGKNYY